MNKRSNTKEIRVPDSIRRIATRNFSYVNLCDKKIMLTGGQFVDDKTCSLDCFKLNLQKLELKEVKSGLKAARMFHSMIHIEEKRLVLAIGGEDENGNLLDTCEVYSRQDKTWKMLNTLN